MKGARYETTTLEYKQRRLADWAFILEDYWLANRTYRSLIELFHADGPDAAQFEAGYLLYPVPRLLFHLILGSSDS